MKTTDYQIRTHLTHWPTVDRLTVAALQVDAEGDAEIIGSLLMDCRKDDNPKWNTTAYLYNLSVEEEHRGKGIAGKMMQTAINHAMLMNRKTASLEWDESESERWTLQWYFRMGFDEKEFSRTSVFAVKEL